jgi:outer membrane protein TolC
VSAVKGFVTMRSLVAAVLVMGTASALQAQEPRRVTLAEALALAARSQPTMVQARQSLRVAEAQERQTVGSFLPNLIFSGNTNKSSSTRIDATSGQPVDIPSQYNSQWGFNSSIDLFTGLRRGAQRSAAQATTNQREEALRRTEYEVAYNTKDAFFLAVAAAELVEVARTALRRADEQLRLTSERLRLGATTRSDSLRAQVAYGNARLELLRRNGNLLYAMAYLGQTIQVEGMVAPAYDTAEIAVTPLDTAQLRLEARANAPAIREAQAALNAADASKRVARAPYMPTLALSGGYTYAASADLPFSGRYLPSWNYRLGLSWTLFDRLSRETSLVSSDASVRNAEAALRNARLDLDTKLTQEYVNLEGQAEAIAISRISLAAAQEDLRLQRERYRLGAVTIIEVLQSEESLLQAQYDFISARYNYLVARAKIEALVGQGL